MWHGLEGIGWGWIVMALLHAALFWAVCLLVLAWLWRGGAPRGRSAMDILGARYAKGELSRDEFERMKRDLGGAGN